MSFDASERRPLGVMAALLIGIFVFMSVDLITDSRAGASMFHLVGEFAIMAFAAMSEKQFTGAGVCMIASALSFGLLANAVFRN